MSADPPVRVLVVDDQRIVREGLTTLLGLLDGVEVAGTATDGEHALRQAEALAPDVVLMDLTMPHMDGIEATRRLAASHPGLPVVVLTTFTDEDRLLGALRAGARGFLTKDAGIAEIEAAVLAAAAGRAALSPEVQDRLLSALRSGAHQGVAPGRVAGPTAPAGGPTTPAAVGVPVFEGLTAREREVVALMCDGLSNTEIADRLVVSTATVKTHVNHIFAKTGLRDRAQLVALALRSRTD